MFRNMVTSLLKHDRIQTTEAKAKELRRWADHIITLAKRGDLHALRQALSIVREKEVVYTVFQNAKDRFGDIPGGYTRMYKIGRRPGDSAPMMLIELVNAKAVKPSSTKKSAGTPASAVKSEIPAAPAATEAAPVTTESASEPDMTAEAVPASDETGPAGTESMTAAAAEAPATESPESPAPAEETTSSLEAQPTEADVSVSNASGDAPDAAAGEAKKEEQ